MFFLGLDIFSMWEFIEVPHGNQKKVKIKKWKMFYSILKKFPESGPGTTHIHTFKENKQNLLTSIIVGLKIYDHIKK
jgi:hypothetical protein